MSATNTMLARVEEAEARNEALSLLISGIVRYLDIKASERGDDFTVTSVLERFIDQLDERSSKFGGDEFKHMQTVFAFYREALGPRNF